MTKVVVTDALGNMSCAVEFCDLLAANGCTPAGSTNAMEAVARVPNLLEKGGAYAPFMFDNAAGNAAVVGGAANTVNPVYGIATTAAPPSGAALTNALKIAAFFGVDPVNGTMRVVAPDGTTKVVSMAAFNNHDTTLLGNQTAANSLRLNPAAFVGTVAANAYANYAARPIKIVGMFNLDCTGGTAGQPKFDVLLAGGGTCTLDFGSVAIPPAPLCNTAGTKTWSPGGSTSGMSVSQPDPNGSPLLVWSDGSSPGGSTNIMFAIINPGGTATILGSTAHGMGTVAWSVTSLSGASGYWGAIGTGISSGTSGVKVFKSTGGAPTLFQYLNVGSRVKNAGMYEDAAGNVYIAIGSSTNGTTQLYKSAGGTAPFALLTTLPAVLKSVKSTSIYEVSPGVLHVAVGSTTAWASYSPAANATKIYQVNSSTGANSLVYTLATAHAAWWNKYQPDTTGALYLSVANAGKDSYGTDTSYVLRWNGTAYSIVASLTGFATSGGGTVTYTGGSCYAFGDWAGANGVRAVKLDDAGNVISVNTLQTANSEYGELVYNGTGYSIVTGGGQSGAPLSIYTFQ